MISNFSKYLGLHFRRENQINYYYNGNVQYREWKRAMHWMVKIFGTAYFSIIIN